jgi:hypothetical protein
MEVIASPRSPADPTEFPAGAVIERFRSLKRAFAVIRAASRIRNRGRPSPAGDARTSWFTSPWRGSASARPCPCCR